MAQKREARQQIDRSNRIREAKERGAETCVGPHGGRSCREYKQRDEVNFSFRLTGRPATWWIKWAAIVRRDKDPDAAEASNNALARALLVNHLERWFTGMKTGGR